MGKRDKEPIRKFSDFLTFCRSNKEVLSEFCFKVHEGEIVSDKFIKEVHHGKRS